MAVSMLPAGLHLQSTAGIAKNARKGESLLMLPRFVNLATPYEFAEETNVQA